MRRMVLALLAVLFLAGCTKAEREDCFVCNAFGLCAILGDSQAGARRKHPAWFLFPGPASQPTSQPATQPAGTGK